MQKRARRLISPRHKRSFSLSRAHKTLHTTPGDRQKSRNSVIAARSVWKRASCDHRLAKFYKNNITTPILFFFYYITIITRISYSIPKKIFPHSSSPIFFLQQCFSQQCIKPKKVSKKRKKIKKTNSIYTFCDKKIVIKSKNKIRRSRSNECMSQQ